MHELRDDQRLLLSRDRGRRARAGVVAVATVAGVAHALLIFPHYHVGSFDDDAHYVLVARALAHGAGLTSTLPSGHPVVVAYPPGYGALLAPLVWLFGNAILPFRVLTLALTAAVYPLTWSYLGRRRVPFGVRTATLALLALNPVLGTYASMVMAEAPFIVVLLALLLAADRWDHQPGLFTAAGAATVALAGGLLWLKEAALGLVVGLVLWQVVRRRWGRAVVAAAGPALLVAPVVVARAMVHTALVGSRYAEEIGAPATLGGHVHQVWLNLGAYLNIALPQSILPTSVSPLPQTGAVAGLLAAVGTATAPVAALGAAVWWFRHRDAASLMLGAYLVETLAYPFINERRLILVLPVVVAWYCVGAAALLEGAVAVLGRGERAAPALAMGLAAVVLVPQLPRDYLLDVGADTSRPGGSPYMATLARLGSSTDVVDTDYLWTTALYSGHRTAWGAATVGCSSGPISTALADDRAAYVLSAALNIPGLVDDDCLLGALSSSPQAVRLYRTDHDLASIFELVGPGTVHPSLVDATPAAPAGAGALPVVAQSPSDHPGTLAVTAAVDHEAVFTWPFDVARVVRQVSIGTAAALAGPTASVRAYLEQADGSWREIGSVRGGVGDRGARPFWLVALPAGRLATALRVTVAADGEVAVGDAHALAER